ncbi:MAG: hypothetical protein ACE5KH_02315 [Candidatus Geothermarchaeales archaeon]
MSVLVQRRKLVLLVMVATLALIGAVAADTVFTWELQFEVADPEVITEIEIGHPIVVGVETHVEVCMRTEEGIEELPGFLTVELYMYDEAEEDWILAEILADGEEVPLYPEFQCFEFHFTPEEAGDYKVVVTLEVG